MAELLFDHQMPCNASFTHYTVYCIPHVLQYTVPPPPQKARAPPGLKTADHAKNSDSYNSLTARLKYVLKAIRAKKIIDAVIINKFMSAGIHKKISR
jgi:hypothetical protein